jgi:hypothetical protein
MGVSASDLSAAVKKRRKKGQDLVECLRAVDEFVRAREPAKALIELEVHCGGTATTDDRRLCLVTAVSALSEEEQLTLDESRLEVCFALDRAIKTRAVQQADDLLALCAVASLLGVGDDDAAAATVSTAGPREPSLAPFDRYLSAAVSLNSQKSVAAAMTTTAFLDVFTSHFDLVESLVHAIEKAAPPGTALAHRGAVILARLLAHAATETGTLLKHFVTESQLADVVVRVSSPEELDASSIEGLLEQSCAVVLQCR